MTNNELVEIAINHGVILEIAENESHKHYQVMLPVCELCKTEPTGMNIKQFDSEEDVLNYINSISSVPENIKKFVKNYYKTKSRIFEVPI